MPSSTDAWVKVPEGRIVFEMRARVLPCELARLLALVATFVANLR